MKTAGQIVKENYSDLGLNRWVMRNKSLNTTLIYTVWGVAVTSMLIPLKPIVPIVSAGIWVLWTWVLALEAMWIGKQRDKIMEILRKEGLNVSWEEAFSQSGIK